MGVDIKYIKNPDGTVKKTSTAINELDGIDPDMRIIEIDNEIKILQDKILEYETEKQKIISIKAK